MPEEELASECEVASLWLLVLLLYSGLQPVACYLPQQEGELPEPSRGRFNSPSHQR